MKTQKFTSLVTLVVSALAFISPQMSRGQHWLPTSTPTTNWSAVISSADGLKAAATVDGGGLFLSTNGGVSWTQSSAPAANWRSLLCSADAGVLIGLADSSYISQDFGQTWRQTSGGFTSIACSADGNKIFGTRWFSTIVYSWDMGTNWSETHSPNPGWQAIACDAAGVRVIAACNNNGQVYQSTNSGIDWFVTSLPSANWNKVVSSADGQRLVAAGNDMFTGLDNMYVSTNGGTTWSFLAQSTANTGRIFGGLSSSADGKVIVAAKFQAIGSPGASILISWDSGKDWFVSDAPATDWNAVTCSADGTHILAAPSSGPVYSLAIDTANTLPPRGTNGTAVFEGLASPAGHESFAWFEWGTTPEHDNATLPQNIGTDITMVSDVVSGLTNGVDYYVRLVVTNSEGLFLGEDKMYRAPVIILNGGDIAIDCDYFFNDPGAYEADEGDPITVTGAVNWFEPGTYTLTYWATNSLGIAGSTNRIVTVRGPMSVTRDLMMNCLALQPTVGRASNTLSKVIAALGAASATNLWLSETRLLYPDGKVFFDRSIKAASLLAQLAKAGVISPNYAINSDYRLVQSARRVASTQITRAGQTGLSSSKIASANRELAAGDRAQEAVKLTAAIGHYRNAWKLASQ